jgi:hypothetical protein
MMAGERIILDPFSEVAANRQLELTDPAAGLYLLEHAYPTPESEEQWASSPETEGERRAHTRPRNRLITAKVRVREPQEEAAENLVHNPSFEVDTSGWNPYMNAGPTGWLVTQSTAQAHGRGRASARVAGGTAAGAGQIGAVSAVDRFDVDANQEYSAAGWALCETNGRLMQTILAWFTAAEVFISSVSSGTSASSAGEWHRSPKLTATAPATAAKAQIYIVFHNPVTGDVFYVDDAMVAPGPVLIDSADGDTPGWDWTGAPHASSSVRPPAGGPRLQAIVNDLEAKVAQLDDEGGTYKRILPSGDPIVFDVVSARAQVPSDQAWVTRQRADIALEFTCLPRGRGAPVLLADHAETSLPALVFTEAGIPGSVPARGLLVVDNDGSSDWEWLAWGVESDADYDIAAASGALFYEAEGRTALGGSSAAAGPSGASGAGSNVMRNAALTTSFLAVLSTQASGAGAHLTHVGTFRLYARVQVPTSNTGTVSVALEWAVGDFLRSKREPPVSIDPVYEGTWWLVDLGLVTIEKVAQGTHRWEGRVLAKSTVAGDDIDIDCLLLRPVNAGSGVARGVAQTPAPTAFLARDEFDQSAGALTGKTAPVGGNWLGSGDTDDLNVNATDHNAFRVTVSDTANTGRHARLDINTAGVVVQADVELRPGP